MRILFSLGNYPPSFFGGVALSIESVVRGLSKSNNDFKLFVLTSCFELPAVTVIETNKWVIKDGYKINYINTKKPNFSFKFIASGCLVIPKVNQVHLSNIFFFPNLLHAYLSLFLGKKVFWSPHGELFKPALYSKIWKKAPYLLLVFFVSPWITFRATSKQEAKRIKRIFPFSTIKYIPNLVPAKVRMAVSKKAQFLYLGRVARIKSLINIIDACAQSNHFLKNGYVFFIAGPIDIASNDYYEEIKQRIDKNNLKEKVIYLGNIPSPDKEKLLAESRALFLVSKSENFGNVVVEALQQGTPVVASKGTPWESLNEKKCGLWLENSPCELSKAIDYFIEMNNLQYKEMCSRAIELSREFQEPSILPSWVQLIKGD